MLVEAQAQEAHEREPVADLILDLVVREIVERLQNQRLEDDDLVPGLASGRGLPLLLRLAPNRAQPRTEVLPGHDRVQDNQRILLGIETAIALAEVEETGLPHSCPLAMKPAGYPPSQSCARERSIFRGALYSSERSAREQGQAALERQIRDDREPARGFQSQGR